MSQVSQIRLLADSACALPGFGTEKTPSLSIKPGEVLWNDMQAEEPSDSHARQLFSTNAEVNQSTSGLVETPRFTWEDWIADQFVDADSIFIFCPHATLFQQQHDEIVQAMVAQKTKYVDFYRQHDRKTGKLKSFEVKTENWFSGIGLILWQCHMFLSKLDPEKRVSLTDLKNIFQELSRRTRTVSILSTKSMHPFFRDIILDESLMGRLTGNLGRSKWVSFELGVKLSDTSEKDSLATQIDAKLRALIDVIEAKRLSFPRVVITCDQKQMHELKNSSTFLQFDKLQSAYGFRWIHQPAPISSQILTGKDAVHISYAIK